MRPGRKPKYGSEEERTAAMKAYQKAYREARKNGTWKRKYRLGLKAAERRRMERQGAKDEIKVLRGARQIVEKMEKAAARENAQVLAKAGRVAQRLAEKAARTAEAEACRRDVEMAEAEIQRQRETEARRRKARLARMTPEELAEDKALRAAARERQATIARERYGFELYGEQRTPAEREAHRRYKADLAKVSEKKLAKKREKLVRKIRAKRHAEEAAQRAREAAMAAAEEVAERMRREQQEAAQRGRRRGMAGDGAVTETHERETPLQRKARHERLLKEYGFRVWKNEPEDPNSEAEREARQRYARAREAEYRARHHQKITDYNRQYRQRRRAEARALAQKTWTAAEWKKWKAREAAKGCKAGTPAWVVQRVVKIIAEEEGVSEELVTERLIETEGIDFLTQGAIALGSEKAKSPAMLKGAARALGLWLDFDHAMLFKPREVRPREAKAAGGEALAGASEAGPDGATATGGGTRA